MELDKYYLIESALTGNLYINKEKKAYVFVNDLQKAKEFSKSIPDTMVSNACSDSDKMKAQVYIRTKCLRNGVQTLVTFKDGETTETIVYTPSVPKEWFNGPLNADINIVKHTKDMEDLKSFKEGRYLVAIKITNKPVVKLEYAIASNKKADYSVLLAFSTVGEFEQWEREFPKSRWEPLMLGYDGLLRVANEDGILINPSGNRMILTPGMIKMIQEEEGK